MKHLFKYAKQFLMTATMALSLIACNESGPVSVNPPTNINNPTGPTNPISPLSPNSPSSNPTNNNGGNTASGKREWTYMVYMGADNSLSDFGMNDLAEMELIGSSDKVSIVVQAEFDPEITTGIFTDTVRLLVEKDADANKINFTQAQSIGNVNMADTKSLADFIKWAAATYPAKNYALVMWDHGAGWKSSQYLTTEVRGAVEDKTSDDFMSLPELAQGVKDSGVHFGVINFDACLMGMYEVAYEYLGLTDYMVYSEEVTPGPGNPYDLILDTLVSNPSITAENLAVASAEAFYVFYKQLEKDIQIAAVDVTAFEALDKKIRDFSAAFVKEKGYTALLKTAEQKTKQFDYQTNHDLYNLMDNLSKGLPNGDAKKLSGDIKKLIKSAVIYNQIAGEGLDNANGIAIYLPMAGEVSGDDMVAYDKLAINKDDSSSWATFIRTYLAAGGVDTDAPVEHGIGGFAAYLNWEGCKADIELLVFEPSKSGGEGQLYGSSTSEKTPNGSFESDDDATLYTANDKVTRGEYTVLVSLRAVEQGCNKLQAHLYVLDPNQGIEQWVELSNENGFNLKNPSPQVMGVEKPYNGEEFESFMELNQYSDWWVPVTTTREIDEVAIESALDVQIEMTKRTESIINDLDGRF